MAKGNLLLGMGRGSIGDVTLYRQNGQQMSRARNRVVKNPKTAPQQIQRMIAATVGYAYAGLKQIVDHSFEGVAYGGPSMNMFRRLNMDALRATAAKASAGDNVGAFAMKGIRTVYPNSYAISRGSLPKIESYGINTGGDDPNRAVIWCDASVTINSLLSSFGAQPGDQVTMVAINIPEGAGTLASYGDGARTEIRVGAVAIRRLKFLTSYTEEQRTTEITSENFANLFDMEVTNTWASWAFKKQGNELIVNLPNDVMAVGFILSRKQGDKWLRSNCDMLVGLNTYGAITSEGYGLAAGLSFENALVSWLAGTEAIGVSAYILNGKPKDGVEPEVDDEGGGDNP